MRRWRIWLIILVIVGIGYFVGVSLGPRSKKFGRDAYPAPSFMLPTLDQRRIGLADFQGRVVLVDFWATWCAPCLAEMPQLDELYRQLQTEGFEIVGVSLDENEQRKAVSEIVHKKKITYPILLSGGLEKAPTGYDIEGLPTAYLIDRQGRVVKVYTGLKQMDKLKQDVEALL